MAGDNPQEKLMTRKLWPLVVLVLSSTAFGQSIPGMEDLGTKDTLKNIESAASGSMAGLLQGQLGLTEDQAQGSIGSLLSLASEKLNSGEFDQLAGMIPGADKSMDAAKRLGAVTGPLESLADLNQSLAALGISPETIEKFVPMVTDYLGKLGGKDAMGLLQKVLG